MICPLIVVLAYQTLQLDLPSFPKSSSISTHMESLSTHQHKWQSTSNDLLYTIKCSEVDLADLKFLHLIPNSLEYIMDFLFQKLKLKQQYKTEAEATLIFKSTAKKAMKQEGYATN